jgi:predicted nucleotidyltransferase
VCFEYSARPTTAIELAIGKERLSMVHHPVNSLSKDEILSILAEHLTDLRQRYHVKSLGVFGSYVRGEQTLGSDVDLLVEFDDPQLTLLQFVELQNHLSDLLGITVDLVEKEMLKPALADNILQEVTPL